ncbi:flagellar basal body rod protein FlgF [Aquimonas sp.]|jgi:flagellar basal-body rod protein FlgF|uniref:flagellar basal body rod protein FlgF n=1 Tax=Aquimonas sp. TaxID=1872588 RepID=UPI0037BE7630
MDKSLYVSMTGASATLRAQGAVSQNLANLSTPGFRALLSHTETFKIEGHGLKSRFDATRADGGFDDRMGPLLSTGRDTDVALREGLWMAVADGEGNEAYTRAGELSVNQNGLLTTASGRQVLGENGPIALPPYSKLEIAGDGSISIVPLGQGAETQAIVARIKVVQAPGAELNRGEDGLFRRADGEPAAQVGGAVLMTGVIESSNVNAADNLVKMIELARSFEMQVRSIKTADENARASNSLLRLSG